MKSSGLRKIPGIMSSGSVVMKEKRVRIYLVVLSLVLCMVAACAGIDDFFDEETDYNATQAPMRSGSAGAGGGEGQRGGMPNMGMVEQMRSSRMSSLNRTPGGMTGGGMAMSGGSGGTTRSTQKKKPTEDTRMLQAGIAAYNVGDYKGAVGKLTQFVEQYTASDSTPDALFFLGESYYRMKNYQKAATNYKKIDSQFSLFPRAGEALYKAGKCFEALGHKTIAERIYKKVSTKYPAFNKNNIID